MLILFKTQHANLRGKPDVKIQLLTNPLSSYRTTLKQQLNGHNSNKHKYPTFISAQFNCCFSVVLPLDKGAYPKISHVVFCLKLNMHSLYPFMCLDKLTARQKDREKDG